MATGALTWAIIWGIAGVAQWLALCRAVPRAGMCVAAGAVSGLAFGIAAKAFSAAQLGTTEGLVGGCIGGILGGLVVWLGLSGVFARAALLISMYAVAVMPGSATAFAFFEPLLRVIDSDCPMRRSHGPPAAHWAVSSTEVSQALGWSGCCANARNPRSTAADIMCAAVCWLTRCCTFFQCLTSGGHEGLDCKDVG